MGHGTRRDLLGTVRIILGKTLPLRLFVQCGTREYPQGATLVGQVNGSRSLNHFPVDGSEIRIWYMVPNDQAPRPDGYPIIKTPHPLLGAITNQRPRRQVMLCSTCTHSFRQGKDKTVHMRPLHAKTIRWLVCRLVERPDQQNFGRNVVTYIYRTRGAVFRP